MQLHDLVTTSARVGDASGRLEKIGLLADLLRRLAPDEIEIAIGFLSGEPRQGRMGIGGAMIWSAKDVLPAETPALQIADVDHAFAQIATTKGAGTAAIKGQRLRELLGRATRQEQDFLARLLFGELRQGALEGVLVEAVAKASTISPVAVRRAAMMAGALAPVARAALVGGESALSGFGVQIFQPVQPMLAQPAHDMGEALDQLGSNTSLEWKLDGARIQVHKRGEDVRVFSRNLRDVTHAVPEIVEATAGLDVDEAILDGEVISLKPDGAPHPFQITMQRFGRKLDVERLRQEIPLTPFFFDCLYVNGEPLIDAPQEQRVDRLTDVGGLNGLGPAASSSLVVPRLVRPTRESAARFLDETLRRGHEGLMVKSLSAGYAAGRRGQNWLKVKIARTLDLVILAAEWGHGRRTGWLSNLHLGARDPVHGGFVMLGKTFKGLTDEMLAWQTERLRTLEIGHDRHTVFVRPELVVEIAFNEVQESPQYPGGLALRFARVKGYRLDKPATEADTIDTVRDLYLRSIGQGARGQG
jgi:DNA ligase-1